MERPNVGLESGLTDAHSEIRHAGQIHNLRVDVALQLAQLLRARGLTASVAVAFLLWFRNATTPWKGIQVVRSILIVDDNAFVRQALCEMFKREGDFDVCGEAENGREAIAKAQQLHPALIVRAFDACNKRP